LDKPPSAFDELSNYMKRVTMQSHDVLYSWDAIQHIIMHVIVQTYQAHSLDLPHPPAPDPEDPALDLLPTLYEFVPMRLPSMPLTTSHFSPCLSGFLLMLPTKILK